jgi:hypothetical protein
MTSINPQGEVDEQGPAQKKRVEEENKFMRGARVGR